MNALEIHDVSVFYHKKKIIQNVTFNLKKGELICLLGANGCGKTTLMKGICSLAKTTGERYIMGSNIADLSQREIAKLITYIPQRCHLNFPISVLDVVLMGFSPYLSVFENTNNEHKRLAKEALVQVGIAEKANSSYLTLSGGEQQLVVLARALVQNTPIMIFDEPDSALDFTNKHKIMSLIKSLINQKKSGIICLHDANCALKYCDRILLIKDNEVVHDLNVKKDTKQEIEIKLKEIYDNIEIVIHNENLIMVQK